MSAPRHLLVAWVGRHRRDDFERLCTRYRERIARWTRIEDRPVRARSAAGEQGRRVAEAAALAAALPSPCWRVALDRRGRAVSSEELAARLASLAAGWPHPVAFLVGSDLGLDPAVLAAAGEVVSFGPVTLPHELARLVLYEQIYRALSLDAGIKYHRPSL